MIPGKYPVVFGSSFFKLANECNEKYINFRYESKPTNALDMEKPGSLIIRGTAARLQIPHKFEPGQNNHFEGSYEVRAAKSLKETEGSTDALLIFDDENKCFVLERLSAQVSGLRLQNVVQVKMHECFPRCTGQYLSMYACRSMCNTCFLNVLRMCIVAWRHMRELSIVHACICRYLQRFKNALSATPVVVLPP